MSSAREQIIEKTCELLELQGYHATGLNQILKESGSPKGSLYYYFPGGKEELASESVAYVGRIVLNRIQHNLMAVDDPAEAIREFMMNIAYNVEASGYRAGGPITTIALETASSSERLREECLRIYSEWRQAFAQKLVSGSMDAARAARLSNLIISTIEGAIILCRTDRSRAPLEDAAQEIYQLIQCG